MPEACNFIEKGLWHRCFPVNFAKFLGILFLQNTSGRLLSVTFFDTGLFVSFRYLKTMVCLENKDPVTREEFDSSRVTGSLFSRRNGPINGSVNTELCVPLNYVYCVPFFVLILLWSSQLVLKKFILEFPKSMIKLPLIWLIHLTL